MVVREVVMLGCGAAWALAAACDAPAGDRARPAAREAAFAAHVPDRAEDALVLARGDVGIEVWFEGARSAAAEVDGPLHRYPGALGVGVDLLRLRVARGVEDWIVFPADPGSRRVRMWIAPRGGGLRLVERVIELVDARGAPRLRMGAPWVADALGARHDVAVSIEGCSVDADPSAPWGRPPTDPGARRCAVDLLLPADLRFPAVLDPLWTDTTGLLQARALHAATRLADGKVLIAGGASADVDLTSAELFDPDTDSFAATGSLAQARRAHTQTLLADGRVLAIGGDVGFGQQALAAVERYDPATGAWTALPPLQEGRAHHAAATLADGDVLVTGSYDYADAIGSRAAERCDPAGEACAIVSPMRERRAGHTLTRLPDGRMLVAGGAARMFSDGSSFHLDTELFDPISQSWSGGPALPVGRVEHTATWDREGRLLLLGGTSAPQGASLPDEVLAIDPVTLAVLPAGSLTTPRWLHAAADLPNGRVLLAGRGTVDYGPPVVTAVEAFDPAAGFSVSAGALGSPRAFATATALLDGRVLVAGGKTGAGPSEVADAVLFGDRLGSACAPGDPTSCANGVCSRGVCAAPPPGAGGGGGGGGGPGDGGGGGGAEGGGGPGGGGAGGSDTTGGGSTGEGASASGGGAAASTGGGGSGTAASSGGGGEGAGSSSGPTSGAAGPSTTSAATGSSGAGAASSDSEGPDSQGPDSGGAGPVDAASPTDESGEGAGSFYACAVPGPPGRSDLAGLALPSGVLAACVARRLARRRRGGVRAGA